MLLWVVEYGHLGSIYVALVICVALVGTMSVSEIVALARLRSRMVLRTDGMAIVLKLGARQPSAGPRPHFALSAAAFGVIFRMFEMKLILAVNFGNLL
jgi:uncharacterized membrane protein YcjF (UPF0283 family)